MQKYFKEVGVHHFTTQNEVKANYAERVIKTLKSRIMRYFTLKQTHKWIDVLSDFTFSYNNTFHRTIKRAPQSVNKDNEVDAWIEQYRPSPERHAVIKQDDTKKRTKIRRNKSIFKFKVGDYVRISNLRGMFEKEYDERWTGEIFKISKRMNRQSFPIYELEDVEGESISGTFYEMELQKVYYNAEGSFKIEKVMKTRKKKGKAEESLVKWMHWPKKYNSWIPSSDVTIYDSSTV